jgi:hypothetical protein
MAGTDLGRGGGGQAGPAGQPDQDAARLAGLEAAACKLEAENRSLRQRLPRPTSASGRTSNGRSLTLSQPFNAAGNMLCFPSFSACGWEHVCFPSFSSRESTA